MVYIIIGVSGCGKTTIGLKLAELLKLPYYDGDDYHSPSNKEKMRKGIPLTDEDRKPWLSLLSENINRWNKEGGSVISCSALKEKYRRILLQHGPAQFIYLKAEKELIRFRLKERKGHFFSPDLMESQFTDLEEPDYAITVAITLSPSEICMEILDKIEKWREDSSPLSCNGSSKFPL